MGVGVSLDRDAFPARDAIIRLCSEEKIRELGNDEGEDDADDEDDKGEEEEEEWGKEKQAKGSRTFRTIMRSQFGVATSQGDVDALEHIALPLCLRLMKNNLWTNNFSRFLSAVIAALHRTLAVPADSISEADVRAATGGLHIVRIALQHMIAGHKGARLLTQMEGDAETARAAFQCLLQYVASPPHCDGNAQDTVDAVNGTCSASTTTAGLKELSASAPASGQVLRQTAASAKTTTDTPVTVSGGCQIGNQYRSTALLLSLRRLLLRPLTTASLVLHVEAVSAVLVLGSVQLYTAEYPLSFSMLDAFVTDARGAHGLFAALHRVLLDMRKADLQADSDNIFRDLATLFSLPFHMLSKSSSERAQELSAAAWGQLRTRVMLLMLVLWSHTPCQAAVRSGMRAASNTNHFLSALGAACPPPPSQSSAVSSSSSSWLSWRAGGRAQHGRREVTVVATQRQQCLVHSEDEASHLVDSQQHEQVGTTLDHKAPPSSLSPPHVPFDLLADVLATCAGDPAGSLFAYNWVYRNLGFRRHLLNSEAHFRPFMLECLRALNKETCSTSQATTVVSLLLVMSRDAVFYERLLSETVGEDAPWHTERDLDGANIMSLLVSVLLRCLNHNWRVDRDEELHRHVLALLCNLSPHIDRLDLYVCQRLIRLLHALLRQFFRLRTDADVSSAQHTGEELAETIRFVHVLLRFINTVITTTVSSNADLMYTLLINKQDFTGLRRQDLFSPEIDNIHSAIMYCEAKLSQSRGRSTRSSSRIQQDLEAAVARFPSDLLKRAPQHRYTYEEGVGAAMCRRVWRCVVDHGNIFPADHGYPFLHDEDR